MDRWERVAALVALLGLAAATLAMSGVVSPGGATYYLETEFVETGSVPHDVPAVPIEESPDPVVDAVTASLVGNASTAEIRPEHRDLVPACVEYEDDVYRVDTWHVDHAVHLSWAVVLVGGVSAFVVGAGGVLAGRIRTAS